MTFKRIWKFAEFDKKISTDKQRFLTIANKTLSYAKIEKKQTLVFAPQKIMPYC